MGPLEGVKVVDMTTVLQKFIEDYVAKHGYATTKKSRRA